MALATMVTTSWAGQGTDVVNFSAHIVFSNTDVEPGASGSADASVNIKGGNDKQSLKVTAKGLTPNTTYSLMATTTSSGGPVDLVDFMTDSKGNAKLTAKKSVPLPNDFGPLTELTELDIVNGDSAAVLTGTSDNVTKLNYKVKKNLTGDTASGTLSTSQTTKSEKFNLSAKKLDANTDYILVLNGNQVQTYTSDKKGNLKITSLPPGSPSPIDLNEVDLTDTGGTTILTTTIP